ncbi:MULTISPECIES: hypothetical protein [Halorussus]|uniref:hypothetical protein n=1 Tax=Halorussus TaxID=1070314 RepID=UPI00209F4261|nr:hypothetical protein [Halorussus vallis]USZ78643.1 hypothetical protein NGM07_25170 [Halorussus vallis]USZ78674.1 hypothetical protein NGM07_24500 [Halorussus vallis]
MTNTTLILGGVAVLIVVLVLVAIDRWGVFESDDENANSGTERLRQEAEREYDDYTVSIFKKHKTLTLPAKVLTVCVSLIFVGGLAYVYLTLKNGAPVELPYANAMQQFAVVAVSFFVGVGYANRRERGRLEIIHEDRDGEVRKSETKYFRPSEMEADRDGNPIVYETFRTRILGLFERRKLAVHDRELRGKRAILHDKIAHEIPSHATQIRDNEWVILTTQRKTTENPDQKAADYRYAPPIQLDYESYVKQRERVQKMEMKYDSMKAQLAETEQEVRRLSDRLEAKDTDVRESFKNDMLEILNTLQQTSAKYTVKQDRGRERQPRSQRDIEELNGDGEGVSA